MDGISFGCAGSTGRTLAPARLGRAAHGAGPEVPPGWREWVWRWLFPAMRGYVHCHTGQRQRHYLQGAVLQRAVREATKALSCQLDPSY